MDKEDKQRRKEKVDELVRSLDEAVVDFMRSDRYIDFLKGMARFHRYSLGNQLLIMSQKPDSTMVASFNTWKKFDRYVRKGEKGIKVLCPVMYKSRSMENAECPLKEAGEVERSKDRKEKDGETLAGFKVGYVFDISQTAQIQGGKPMPTILDELEGDLSEDNKVIFKALMDSSAVPVFFKKLPDGLDGYYSLEDREIVLRDNMSETQTMKTLIHEMAHSILDAKDSPERGDTKELREARAESVAFVVCSHFNIDSSAFSLGYISSWSNTRDAKELKESLQVIRDTSCGIIDKVEDRLSEKIKKTETITDDVGQTGTIIEEGKPEGAESQAEKAANRSLRKGRGRCI